MSIKINQSRRDFLKNTGLVSAGIGLAGTAFLSAGKKAPLNSIPRWRGFNLLDFFSPDPTNTRPPTKEEYFQWMRDWGFDFVRIPMAYPYYVEFDRSRNIHPDEVYNINEEAVDKIDELVTMAHKYGMHVSLNLHRAPGYSIRVDRMWIMKIGMDINWIENCLIC